jgi:hypothetical protein
MTKKKMFPLNLRSVNLSQPYAQNLSNTDETLLCHARFDHIPFKSLSLVQKHVMVNDLPILNEHDSPCESCIFGKHKRYNFPTSANREKEHLESVHTEIRGPMQTQSIGRSFYFMTFINDFSRKIWIYFLKNKYDTFSNFRYFKSEVKKISGKYVKVLGGGEYYSKEFADFCRHQGIIMQTKNIYTPQKNGVVERKN